MRLESAAASRSSVGGGKKIPASRVPHVKNKFCWVMKFVFSDKNGFPGYTLGEEKV